MPIMENFLTYIFIQRALWAGFFISFACAVLGVFLVLRRDAMLGHGLAHVTFTGVALGLFLYITPTLIALAVAILAALGMSKLKMRTGLYGDTAIGIVSSLGMALGIIIVTLAGSFNVDLFGYLFGNILAIEKEEVWLALILALGVLITVAFFYQEFLFLTFDPESAQASGIQVARLESFMAMLAAITVVLAMKVVGILLVSALLVIPAAAALQVAKSFFQAMLISAIVALVSVLGGLVIAFFLDWPVSGTIVSFSAILFFLLYQIRRHRRF